MTSFLTTLISEAVQHPVYSVLLFTAACATLGAWRGQRRLDRVLADIDADLPSNVRVLPTQREAS